MRWLCAFRGLRFPRLGKLLGALGITPPQPTEWIINGFIVEQAPMPPTPAMPVINGFIVSEE